MGNYLAWSRAMGVIAFLMSVVGAVECRSADSTVSQRKPNIIIILADDLGWGDLGCYGSPNIRTPNLDALASQGMRFTDFYSTAEVCTPSRTALLTGRYPIRSGMCSDKVRVIMRPGRGGLPASEITLGQAMQSAGYATACIGKWHLGNYMNDPAHFPRKHGFDFYFGLPHSNDMNPAPNAPKGATRRLDQQDNWWNAPLFRNEELLEQPTDQRQLTRRYTEQATQFIHANREKPFLVYLAHTFPHVPLFASSQTSGKSRRGLYGDVVEELDWSVGQIVQALRSEGLDKDTLVFFTSDNGPWLTQGEAGGSAGPFKDGKGSTWEGGMRVPGIACWPGHVPAGVVTSEVACNMDFFATAIQLAGGKIPADRAIDAVDMSPILLHNAASERKVFFYYRGMQLYAARMGNYKAHFTTRTGYGPEPAVPHDPPFLFDLAHDPGEQYDVAKDHAEILSAIAAEVQKHKATVTPVKNQLEDIEKGK